MELRNYFAILRKEWILLVAVLGVALAAGVLYTLQATPQYSSSVTFFITTPSGSDSASAYQGGLFSQQRVASYATLITGDRLAKSVIKDSGVALNPAQFKKQITAAAQPNTVLLTATVSDPSAERAQRLAQSVGSQFTKLVEDLETPPGRTTSAIKAEVVESPQLPSRPVSPKPLLDIGLAAILGLLAGIALAVLRETLDVTMKTPDQLHDLSDAPNLAIIAFDAQAKAAPLIVQDPSHPARSEAFRQLRTNLQFVDVDHPPHIVVVTSALPGEGKSTTAANLAITLAAAGTSTVLVEGDLRRPKMVDYLGLEGAVGLTNILVGQVELDDVLQPWGRYGLTVLASGSIPPNPSELLASQNMTDLLDLLTARFAIVIVDAPPLLPVTDGAILAAKSDGALLVIRHGGTTKGQAQHAIAALRSVDARVLGTVLNMAPAKGPDAYAYGYGYGYLDQDGKRPRLTDDPRPHSRMNTPSPRTSTSEEVLR
ncbi:MAG: polysaccharide biosynthesis tyrosine autokinase [Actinomycetota bacterium]|nr:polysaccharide biosynthesis tyrosine autokinase [Actinomycetota bacterium]